MYSTSIIVLLSIGFAFGKQALLCAENEEFSSCGTLCELTCQKTEVRACPDTCAQGCFCKEGFIRRSENSSCVPLKTCETVPQCSKDEEYTTCGSLCPKTCAADSPRICSDICVETCVCKEGFIRNIQGGACVRESSCIKDTARAAKEACKANEVYQDCGTSCPGTCSEPVKICYEGCAEGCFCKEDHILDDETLECIKIDTCSNKMI